jgi:hypothetical protein
MMFTAPSILAAVGIMFGQASGPSQAEIVGWVVLASLTISGLAVNVMSLSRANKSQQRDVTLHEPWATQSATESSATAFVVRMTKAEASIDDLWTTMRQEDEAIRIEVRKCFQDIERALGRIEGQLTKTRR